MPPSGNKRPSSDTPSTTRQDKASRPQDKATKSVRDETDPADSQAEAGQPDKNGTETHPDEPSRPGIAKERMFEHGDFDTVRPQRLILTQKSSQGFEAATVIEGETPTFEPPPPPKPIPVITPVMTKLRALRAAIDHRATLAFPGAPKYLIGAVTLGTTLFVTITIAAVSKLVYDRHFAPPKPPEPPPPPALQLPLPANALTRDVEIGAFETVKAYLEADGIDAKLPFIRHPEKSRPAMEAWYADPANADLAKTRQAGEIIFRKRIPLAGHDAIALAIDVYPQATTEFFLIERYPSGEFKIDWESSSGYQPVGLDRFKEIKPVTPHAFRVTVQRSDYFNYGFTQAKFDCYRLTYPTAPGFLLYGYVDKLTDLSQQLLSLFPSSNAPTSNSLILNLAYPPDPSSPDQVIIYGIANPHWLEE